MQESTQWQTTDSRKGVFDDYTVMGLKYQNPGDEVGWQITAWKSGFNPTHGYWVTGENFCSVSIHWAYQGTRNLIQIDSPPITEQIEIAERKAVLKAISEWSKDEVT